MSEYGRYVQSMVDYIKTLPDKETRNKAAETVVINDDCKGPI